jgi:GT2 family glycosyltransferase/spore maturation protein CgeB
MLAGLPPGALVEGPLVTIIILTRDGLRHLRTVMPALDRVAYRSFEVVVVDNGSSDGTASYLHGLRPRYDLRIVRNETNRSFAEANGQGEAIARGELLLLLNNDVDPIGPDFLGHLVETMVGAPDVAVVGARLVYPRRRGRPTGPITTAPDLTLQHRGTDFATIDGTLRARNLGDGEDPDTPIARSIREVPAVTAACALVRRAAWQAVGGMSEAYDYGMEDVEFCLALRSGGWRIVCDGRAVLWHDASATQHRTAFEIRSRRQEQNRAIFAGRWGKRLFREVFLDRLHGGRAWSEDSLHVGITVTRDDPSAGWGDLYTARELGAAFAGLGWTVSFLERFEDRWYRPPTDLDVVIVLLDAFDIRRIPTGVVKVAWCRNWIDRWLERPWFEDYDLVFAGSEIARAAIERSSSVAAEVMPLATNPERFKPRDPDPALAVDVAFVGNLWGEERGVARVLGDLVTGGRTVGAWGRGWSEHVSASGLDRGQLPYEEVPDVYASADIVVDDTATPTKPWGLVNGRVFDALAAGTVVVSDNEAGVRELFDDEFPTWADSESLALVVEELRADPSRRRELIARYRGIVVDRHTYAHRAGQIRDALALWASASRVSLLIGAPNHDVATTWGDLHFARGLQRRFRCLGRPTSVRILPEWEDSVTTRSDLVMHLFGLKEYTPQPGPLNMLWVISHPDLVTDDAANAFDAVLVASDPFATELASRLRAPVHPLHQATDPDRFRPDAVGPHHDLLFVANSRGVRRKMIDDLTPTPHDLAVYGKGWRPEMLEPRYLRGENIPNAELAGYYANADIVLNDHWPDMRRLGFLSNRLYDAMAAGAFVISDNAPGIDDEFDRAVATYDTASELRVLVDHYLPDAAARRERADRGRAAVVARHTFAHRVAAIIEMTDPLLADRPSRILEGTVRTGD